MPLPHFLLIKTLEKPILFRIPTIFFLLFCLTQAYGQKTKLNYYAICFYYNWYGSVKVDGSPWHWEHPIMPQNDKDTTSGFYPTFGSITSL